MKVEIEVKPWRGTGRVAMEEAGISLVSHIRVDGIVVWSKGEPTFRLNADGFLELEIPKVRKETWDEFMANHTIDEVGFGSGILVAEPEPHLIWALNCALILPVTEIVTVEAP